MFYVCPTEKNKTKKKTLPRQEMETSISYTELSVKNKILVQ